MLFDFQPVFRGCEAWSHAGPIETIRPCNRQESCLVSVGASPVAVAKKAG
jgi:hypothetical protein